MSLRTRAAQLRSLPDVVWGIRGIAAELAPAIAPAIAAASGRACETRGIPRVIHTVFGLWDTRRIPWHSRLILGGWRRRHPAPEWTIVCWNRLTAEAFIQRDSPEHWDLYQSLPRNAQRADLLRYLLLYRLGGFYVDLDVRCHVGIDRQQREHADAGVLACVEATLTPQEAHRIGVQEPIRNGRAEHTERIANFFLGAQAGHPLLRAIIALLVQRSVLAIHTDYDVLYTTGPDVVTEAIQCAREAHDLVVIGQPEANRLFEHLEFGNWRSASS
jgi:mannosyltransferase OCH1-like enzyme